MDRISQMPSPSNRRNGDEDQNEVHTDTAGTKTTGPSRSSLRKTASGAFGRQRLNKSTLDVSSSQKPSMECGESLASTFEDVETDNDENDDESSMTQCIFATSTPTFPTRASSEAGSPRGFPQAFVQPTRGAPASSTDGDQLYQRNASHRKTYPAAQSADICSFSQQSDDDIVAETIDLGQFISQSKAAAAARSLGTSSQRQLSTIPAKGKARRRNTPNANYSNGSKKSGWTRTGSPTLRDEPRLRQSRDDRVTLETCDLFAEDDNEQDEYEDGSEDDTNGSQINFQDSFQDAQGSQQYTEDEDDSCAPAPARKRSYSSKHHH